MNESLESPLVGLVMGSDSDWPTLGPAAEILEDFGVSYEADVVSAHRMPEDMIRYGRTAEERGIRVLIAGAGGAAHLPGMLASVTSLPVVGVPVQLKTLDGMDSLLSIVQMPAGVPVATVSINGAKNAGLLALRILGAGDTKEAEELRGQLAEYAEGLRQTAQDKGVALAQKVRSRKQDMDGPDGNPASGRTPEAAEDYDDDPPAGYAP